MTGISPVPPFVPSPVWRLDVFRPNGIILLAAIIVVATWVFLRFRCQKEYKDKLEKLELLWNESKDKDPKGVAKRITLDDYKKIFQEHIRGWSYGDNFSGTQRVKSIQNTITKILVGELGIELFCEEVAFYASKVLSREGRFHEGCRLLGEVIKIFKNKKNKGEKELFPQKELQNYVREFLKIGRPDSKELKADPMKKLNYFLTIYIYLQGFDPNNNNIKKIITCYNAVKENDNLISTFFKNNKIFELQNSSDYEKELKNLNNKKNKSETDKQKFYELLDLAICDIHKYATDSDVCAIVEAFFVQQKKKMDSPQLVALYVVQMIQNMSFPDGCELLKQALSVAKSEEEPIILDRIRNFLSCGEPKTSDLTKEGNGLKMPILDLFLALESKNKLADFEEERLHVATQYQVFVNNYNMEVKSRARGESESKVAVRDEDGLLKAFMAKNWKYFENPIAT